MTDLSGDDRGPVLGILAVDPEVDVGWRDEDSVGVFEAAGGNGVNPNEVLGGKEGAGFRGRADKIGDDVVPLVAEFLGQGGHAAGLALAAFGEKSQSLAALRTSSALRRLACKRGARASPRVVLPAPGRPITRMIMVVGWQYSVSI